MEVPQRGPRAQPRWGSAPKSEFQHHVSFCKFSADFDAECMKCVPMTRSNITSTGYGSLHACNHPPTHRLAPFSPDLCKSMALLGRGIGTTGLRSQLRLCTPNGNSPRPIQFFSGARYASVTVIVLGLSLSPGLAAQVHTMCDKTVAPRLQC